MIQNRSRFGRYSWLTTGLALTAAMSCECDAINDKTQIVRIDVDDSEFAELGRSADELLGLAERAGATTERAAVGDSCEPYVVGIKLKIAAEGELDFEHYTVQTESCDGGGQRIVVNAHAQLSLHWGAYEVFDQAGVKFFHPEEIYVPEKLDFSAVTSGERSPSFMTRSYNVHRTHPVELSAPLDDEGVDMAGFQHNWLDWSLAMRLNRFSGVDGEYVGTRPADFGSWRSTGMNLANNQQGGNPVISPDDPRSEEEQIIEAIEQRMAPDDAGRVPFEFGFSFNPSEFTEEDHEVTLGRINTIVSHLEENYPDTQIWTIYHGTHMEPAEPYGLPFFELPRLASGSLGIQTHLLMFYDVIRPAPVYGNTDFTNVRDFILEEAPKRRIRHYPETSWWLTFDLPVPLYLAPVSIEARQADIDFMKPMLSTSIDDKTGVYGHHAFTSGQEWGYWLADYCFAKMSWDVEFTYLDCLDEFTGVMTDGKTVYDILIAVTERQIDDMRDDELIRFLVGSDDETEIALDAGIHFHALPPRPEAILNYSDDQVASLRTLSLEPLGQMAEDYAGWAETLSAVVDKQPREEEARLVREVRDGVEIFGLRAAHAIAVYETALELREALAAGDLLAVETAHDGVERARAVTDAAREVVRRREKDYRYPEELTIDGDEPGTPGAVENKTIYPYRVLGRTHRMFYWTRPDDQLAALFGEGLELVTPSTRVIRDGTPLAINVVADDLDDISLDWGDGDVEAVIGEHTYAGQGVYDWSLNATGPTSVIVHNDQAAVVERRFVFKKGRLKVKEPEGAGAINGLLPGLVIGLLSGGEDQWVLGRIDGKIDAYTQNKAEHESLVVRSRTDLQSGPEDLALFVVDVGDVNVYDADMTLSEIEAPRWRLEIVGKMSVDEIVALLVGVGGFDDEGARALIAEILGYTSDTLPDLLDMRIQADGLEDDGTSLQELDDALAD